MKIKCIKQNVLRFWMLALLVGFFVTNQPCAAFPSNSLYTTTLNFIDQSGKDFSLNQLAGQYIVITMAYSSCGSACPMTMARLRNFDEALVKGNKKAEIVIVSLDPARDDPQKLSEFQSKQGKESSSWHLLTGKEEEIRKMSLLLGISYQRDQKSGEINHSNKVLLLDRQGTIVSEVEGLNGDLSGLIEAIKN